MSEEAGIPALPRAQWQNIIADDALQPLHTIVAGHAKFAAMRKVGEADGIADCPVFIEGIAIASGHQPAGDIFEGGSQFGVMVMETRVFHDGPGGGIIPSTNSLVRIENSLRDTIFVTPMDFARFQVSISSWLANARIGRVRNC